MFVTGLMNIEHLSSQQTDEFDTTDEKVVRTNFQLFIANISDPGVRNLLVVNAQVVPAATWVNLLYLQVEGSLNEHGIDRQVPRKQGFFVNFCQRYCAAAVEIIHIPSLKNLIPIHEE